MRTRSTLSMIAAVALIAGCGGPPTDEDGPEASPSPTIEAPVDVSDYASAEEALIVASRTSNILLAQAALAEGANPDAVDADSGHTGLTTAAMRGDVEMVQLLVDAGATVEDQDAGYSPVALSASGEVTQVLLNAGASAHGFGDSVGTPLMAAIYRQHTDVVEVLLQAGADPSVVWVDESIPQPFMTPLLASLSNYAYDITRLLLEYGADPTVVDFSGASPKEWAQTRGNLELVELIESYGG